MYQIRVLLYDQKINDSKNRLPKLSSLPTCTKMSTHVFVSAHTNQKYDNLKCAKFHPLLVKLGLKGLELIFRERRLCWYGYMERSSSTDKTACDLQVIGI